MAKEKFVLQDGERVVREDYGMWLKSKMRGYQARICLTDRRFVVATTGIPGLGGLIGLLFNRKGTVRVSLTKSEITGVEETKSYGVAGVVQVNTTSDTPVMFRAPYEEWKKAIEAWTTGS